MVETGHHHHHQPPPSQPPPPAVVAPPLGAARGKIFPPAEQLLQLNYCIHSNPSLGLYFLAQKFPRAHTESGAVFFAGVLMLILFCSWLIIYFTGLMEYYLTDKRVMNCILLFLIWSKSGRNCILTKKVWSFQWSALMMESCSIFF